MIKKLKPVDENCLLKKCEFSEDGNIWEEFYLLGYAEDCSLSKGNTTFRGIYFSVNKLENNDQDNIKKYGYSQFLMFPYARRIKNIIYGDEDE